MFIKFERNKKQNKKIIKAKAARRNNTCPACLRQT
jgi:hypothetical protein